MRFRIAKRRCDKLNATPNWLTNQQKEEMHLIYRIAERITQNTGIQHDVDHILPLKHKLCCGLNVPWNLQILPDLDNKSKGNRFTQ